MEKKQTTIKDIAAILNLHHTTVSKALRDHPDIKPATKELVKSLAEELDYHPNHIAQSFKTRRTRTIGVIVPSILNDFYVPVISGIEEVAYNNGYTITVCQTHENFEREVVNIRALISNLVAGLIIAISQNTKTGDHLSICKKRGIPLVLLGRVCEDIAASKVLSDNYGGSFQAVEHLIKSGYKKIAHFAGPKDINVGRDRLQGYLDALAKYDIPIDEDLIILCGFQEEDGLVAFQKLRTIGKKVDAIFAVNDPVAIGAYMQIRKSGLRIPDDIALCGFGDTKLGAYLDPPLTTVRQSPYNLGKSSATMLLKQIEKIQESFAPEEKIHDVQLIIRKST